MMLKLKLQYFGHFMRRVDSLEKTLMLGGIGGRRRRGRPRMRWLDGITDSKDVSLSEFGSWWWTGRPGVLRFMGSQRVGHDCATELNWTDMSAIVRYFEHSLALPFFGIGMKTDLFQSYGHCWVFQTCWHIECSTFTASSFRIWNSSTGIPSPPLALFVVMLSKAHLTSQSRISGSRWVITPSWLSGLWSSFMYSSSVYSYHLLLISSASVKFLQFLSFIEPIFAWNVPLVSLIFF